MDDSTNDEKAGDSLHECIQASSCKQKSNENTCEPAQEMSEFSNASYNVLTSAADEDGIKYEYKIAVLFALKCKRLKYKDFFILQNAEHAGALDDVIVYVKTDEEEKSLGFFQLKHKKRITGRITIEQAKYEKSFLKIYENLIEETKQETIKLLVKTNVPFDKMQFIFFTNANKANYDTNNYERVDAVNNSFKHLCTSDDLSELNQNEAAVVNDLQECIRKIIFVDTQNCSKEIRDAVKDHLQDISKIFYSLKDKHDAENLQSVILEKFKKYFSKDNASTSDTAKNLTKSVKEWLLKRQFYRQFYIANQQASVSDLNNLIKEELELIFDCIEYSGYNKALEYLIDKVKEWFDGNGKVLSKSDVEKLISEGIRSTFVQNRAPNITYRRLADEKWVKLKHIMAQFQAVVFQNEQLIFDQIFEEQNSHKLIRCDTAHNEIVLKMLHLCANVNVFWLQPKDTFHLFKESVRYHNISAFITLQDVQSPQQLSIYNYIFQGRNTTFANIVSLEPKVRESFGTDHILQLLEGSLSIGKEIFKCPKNYISRSLPKLLLSKFVLSIPNRRFIIIDQNSYFHDNRDKILNEMKQQNIHKHSDSNHDCFIWETIENENILITEDKNVHILKLHKYISNYDFVLEWIKSSANVNELKQYILENPPSIEQINNDEKYFFSKYKNKVVIVSNPGMGKTTFLNNLCSGYLEDFWVIFITLRYVNYNKINSLEKFIKDYEETLDERDLFRKYLNDNKVVMLFDSFDEVYREYEKTAVDMIKGAIAKGLKVIVATREKTNNHLLESLNVLPNTLLPFDKKDQNEYLKAHFQQYLKEKENVNVLNEDKVRKIENFVTEVIEQFGKVQFTANPLQAQMLAETYQKQCIKYCENNDFKFLSNLTLPELYEKFMDYKFSIYWEVKAALKVVPKEYNNIIKGPKNEFYSTHMEAAVKTTFEQNDTKMRSNIPAQDIIKYGIITSINGHGKADFGHQTFREFFAAKSLVENINNTQDKSIYEKLLEPENYVVKDMFDRLLCKDCALHTAVLNNDAEKVKELLENNGQEDTNKCGRSAIHLICSKGGKHEWDGNKISRIEKEEYLDVFDLLLQHDMWTHEKDSILSWTPQKYIEKRMAVGITDKLLKYNIEEFQYLIDKKWNTEDILLMCTRYDYANLTSKMIAFHNIKLIELEAMKFGAKNDSLLHKTVNYGNSEVLKALLNHKMDIDIKNVYEEPPLFYGVDNVKITKILIENGANIGLRDKYGYTVYDEMYRMRNSKEVSSYLSQYHILKKGFGEDVNAKLFGDWRVTALFVAALSGNEDTVKKLIEKGAKVNFSNMDSKDNNERENNRIINSHMMSSWTALHVAVYFNKTKVVQELLKRKDIKTDMRRSCFSSPTKLTPLGFARYRNNAKIFRILYECTNQKTVEDIQFFSNIERNNVGTKVSHINDEADFAELEARRKTFASFPSHLTELVEEMAKAGLLYTTIGDMVRCYKCHHQLYNWEPEQNPWFRHAENIPSCVFLLGEKGEDFMAHFANPLSKELSDRYSDVEERKKTFVGYPENLAELKDKLAEAGWIYTGIDSTVRCFTCGKYLTSWTPEQNPYIEHAIINPECEFVIREKGEDFIERCAEPLSKSDEYLDVKKRKETFVNFPKELSGFVDKIVYAGFYYIGIEDCVRCFTCGQYIHKWLPEDSAWVGHAAYSPECKYLRENMEKGFIEMCATPMKSELSDKYSNAESRRETFQNYPGKLSHLVNSMVECGFFYLGIDDTVRCFKCGIDVSQWTPQDSPRDKHKKVSPDCTHLHEV